MRQYWIQTCVAFEFTSPRTYIQVLVNIYQNYPEPANQQNYFPTNQENFSYSRRLIDTDKNDSTVYFRFKTNILSQSQPGLCFTKQS